MTASEFRALRAVARANARDSLPSTADLRSAGIHPLTIRSVRRHGWIELHLPAVGTDGFRLTEPGTDALREANAGAARAALRRLRRRLRRTSGT